MGVGPELELMTLAKNGLKMSGVNSGFYPQTSSSTTMEAPKYVHIDACGLWRLLY